MQVLLNVLIYGLLLGGVYAVMAYGLGLIYGVMRVVNLAHGAVLTLAAYGAYALHGRFGLDPLLAIPILVPAAYAAGALLYRLLVRHTAGGPPMAAMLQLFGVALVARNAVYLIWTGDDRSLPVAYALVTVDLGASVPLTKLIVFAAAVFAWIALALLFRRSALGRAIRAVAQDPVAAALSGLDVEATRARAFGLGTAVGALGGVLLASQYVINPEFGGSFLLKSFCIIVLGGMDSMTGVFAGALLLGTAETAAGVYGAPFLQDIVSFLLLVLMLVVRPAGLPSLVRR